MNTNIYIYGNVNFSGKTAAAKRMLYYAKALADEKHKVYLLNCCKDKFEHENFVKIATGIYLLNTNDLTHSFFGSFSFLSRLNRFSEMENAKAVFIIYPQSYFNLEFLSVLYFKWSKKKKVYFELNEVKKYYLFLYKSISNSKLKAFYKIGIHTVRFVLMDKLMRYYDGLICISKNIESYGKQYNENTIRIPILTDSQIETKVSNKVYHKKDHFNIGFSGSIVPSKENLFEFMSVLNKIHKEGKKIALNLCGTVSKKDYDLIENNYNLYNNYTYWGSLNELELASFLQQQDLLVLPRGFTLQNKYGFSTKLSDYINHKKVVLVTDISDNGLYIKDGFNGFIVEPDDSDAMYDKLIYIIENFNKLENAIIENAFHTSKNEFDFRRYSIPLRTFLKSVP